MEKDLRLKDLKESNSFIAQYIKDKNNILVPQDFANLVEFHSRWSAKKFSEHLVLAWQELYPNDPHVFKYAWSHHLKTNNLSELQAMWSHQQTHLPDLEKSNQTLTKLLIDAYKQRHSPWLKLDTTEPILDLYADKHRNPVLNINMHMALYEYWKKFPEHKSTQRYLDAAQKSFEQIENRTQSLPTQMQTFVEKLSQKLNTAQAQSGP